MVVKVRASVSAASRARRFSSRILPVRPPFFISSHSAPLPPALQGTHLSRYARWLCLEALPLKSEANCEQPEM